ncbi:multiple sugar transport system permease protein [Microbacteriaceae bacterium SG_E_30_P1]|uniref:Multiple sugar transport system permease protein n=1 Tax=Antiquaquibacter oligotrophicus TaxID=2880260 RepID=A0ABT6KJR1_9MICO|nr:sugar ABC transporter permease [Antiquaquibacter oligotrophicus]MDH6180170.1 multiple sugar transport system permease protein [Antiquaquibacter oligotrophicus]UDF14078.1 sugar ABC transporter permease [Antiquaquibacter oligotrophicus]
MSTNTPLAAAPLTERQPAGVRRGRAGSTTRAQAVTGYFFVSGYTLFLVFFGILPALYAVFLAFTKQGAFVGVDNFARVFADYRFLPAVAHVAAYVAIWLVALLLFVVLLALIVHAIRVRWLSNASRFIFYIPGALAGAASVMLWLFVLDPTVSPVSFLLRALGSESLVTTVQLDSLPIVLAIIAFWTGAGGWIVIMYGALNNISTDVMEAARIDGSGPISTAWYIQIPLLRKWISYMAILSLAAGTQLFVEPRVLSQATRGVVPQDYSLNQLAFLYAFRQNDFNGSAAISLVLLVVALGLSVFFVFRGGLFERD